MEFLELEKTQADLDGHVIEFAIKKNSVVDRDFFNVFNTESTNPINYIPLLPNPSKQYHTWFKNRNIEKI